MFSATTTRRSGMDIVAKRKTIFDDLIEDARENAPKRAAVSIERTDKAIHSMIDYSRFVSVKVSPRTIMTSVGPVTYRRRCYFDTFGERYIWPLDSLLGVPPRAKVSPELKRIAVEKAAFMPYSLAGENCSAIGGVSKSTVCRAVRDAAVGEATRRSFGAAAAVHLQIDEKYMGFCGSRRKRPRYTATIHCGAAPVGKKGRKALQKRILLSAETPAKLAKKVNARLKRTYGLGIDDRIWVSGDLASYIRDFPERITCCGSVYVPDKWHVCKALADAYPELGTIAPSAVQGIMDLVMAIGDLSRLDKANALDLATLYRKDPKCFERWYDEGYSGCSQEGMNSHYYAPRSAKLASRFKPSTVEKLCRIAEARRNGERISISIRGRAPDDMDQLPWLGKAYEDRMKYDIDTSRMEVGTRKAIDSIRCGGLL